MQTPRKINLHCALIRPILFMGGERRLVLLNITFIAMLLLGVGIHYITIGLAIFLSTLGHWCLVQAAKNDPFMSMIYLRHIQYQDFYPGGSFTKSMIKKSYSSIPEKKLMWMS